MTTYYTYNETTKQLTPAPRTIREGDRTIIPNAKRHASMGAYPLGTDTPPTPSEGKIAVPSGYELQPDGKWHRTYDIEDAPPPPPRTFSKLKIVAALMQAGVWTQVRQYIVDNDLYDLYLAAQDFAEDNEYFVQGKTALQAALGWTDEQVEAVLTQAQI